MKQRIRFASREIPATTPSSGFWEQTRWKRTVRSTGRKWRRKFSPDHKLLEAINAVIHPAVKAYILQEIEAEREAGKIDAFFVEAALLIEEGYGELLDELWYIFAQKEVRRKRLMQDRGYSEEKVEQIFASQLSEEEFRCHCKVVIDNSADLGDTYRQIDERLKEAGLSR